MLSEAVLAVTYRCNARCLMCDIWKKGGHYKELEPEYFRELPRTLRHINITGGEPFLRNDICDIVKNVKYACPNARIVISTNGFLPEIVEQRMADIRYAGLRVSVDGPESLHNKIRGASDAYQNAVETIKRAKRMNIRNLGIGFTATRFNIQAMSDVKKLADDFGAEFTCAIVHSSEHYFGDQHTSIPDPEIAAAEFKKIQLAHLKSSRPKEWFRAYFMQGLIDYIHGAARRVKCPAARISFFMDPYGSVYPCNILNIKIGSLGQGIQRRIGSCAHNCWMICTVGPTIRRNPFPAIYWIVRNKFKQKNEKVH